MLAGTEPGQRAFAEFAATRADEVLDVVKDSFVSGVQLSLRVVAAIALVGLIIAIRGVHPKSTAPEPVTSRAKAPPRNPPRLNPAPSNGNDLVPHGDPGHPPHAPRFKVLPLLRPSSVSGSSA